MNLFRHKTTISGDERTQALLNARIPDSKARRFIENTLKVPIHQLASNTAYMKVGSEKVWASYRACDLTANIMLSTRFRIRGQKTGTPVVNKELERLMTQPNPWDTWQELIYQWTFHMKLTGTAYWYKDQMDKRGRPLHIYPLIPQFVKPIPDEQKKIAGYIYEVNGKSIKFDTDEIIHFKRPHPSDVIKGLGDVEPCKELFREYIMRGDLETRFLSNGAMPSGVLTKKDAVEEEEEWARMKKWWSANYEGRDNAGKTAFLNGDWSYLKLGLTHQEMQSIDSEKWGVEQIFNAHGVPLSLAGIEKASNFSCLPAGELVSTPFGPKPIESLSSGDSIYQFDEHRGSVVVPVDAIIPQPNKAEIYHIETDGRSLRASGNHPILCVDRKKGNGNASKPECKLVWRNAEDVSRGDFVITLYDLPEEEGGFPEPLRGLIHDEEAAAYVLGQYVGDGSGATLNRKRIGGFAIAAHHTSGLQQDVKSLLWDGFRVKATAHPTAVTWNSRKMVRAMVAAGFSGHSKDKQIPDWVFNLPKHLQEQFAAGLVDSDGSVHPRGTMSFGVSNEKLAEQFRHLLMGLGCPVTRLRYSYVDSNYGGCDFWRFTVSAMHSWSLPLRHPTKAGRVAECKAKPDTGFGKRIPRSYWLDTLDLPEGYSVQKVRDAYKTEEETVYDLATVGSHTFIASGIVTHNTSRNDERNFRKYVVVPLLELLVGKLNGIMPDGAPALIEAYSAAWEMHYELSGLIDVEQTHKDYKPLVDVGAMSLNELREVCGLERVSDPLLDGYYVDQSRIPLEMSGLTQTPSDEEIDDATGGDPPDPEGDEDEGEGDEE